MEAAGEIGAPSTVVNRRPQKDPAHALFGADVVHVKWPTREDRYEVGLKAIRASMIRAVAVLQTVGEQSGSVIQLGSACAVWTTSGIIPNKSPEHRRR